MALLDSIRQFNTALQERLALPLNTLGELLRGKVGNTIQSTRNAQQVGFVESDEELTQQQSQTESFATVFNTWQRISRLRGTASQHTNGDTYSDEAIPSELDAWIFNEVDNKVVCTINSVSLVGFISNYRYEDFTLEARLSSTSTDDDFIGLCIAHARDAEGNTHTLTAVRGFNGRAPLVIDKDLVGFNDSDLELARVYSGLQWADGSEATESISSISGVGWGTVPDGVLLKVTREGDIITVEAGRNGADDYHAPATVVIDLASNPELEVFRGPQRYGYVCQSQASSTFEVLDRPGERLPIIDVRDYRLFEYQNDTWQVTANGLPAIISNGVLVPNQVHYNPTTQRFFYLVDSTELVPIT